MAKKKKQAEDAPAGAPAWVMTFADLMSLLMCFFVLLLSFSELDAAKYKQVAGSMKLAFGVQRTVKSSESPRGVSIIAKEFTPGKPQPTMEKVLQQKTTDDNQAYLELLRRDELERLLKSGVVGDPPTKKSAGEDKGADGQEKGTGRDGDGKGTGVDGNGAGSPNADTDGGKRGIEADGESENEHKMMAGASQRGDAAGGESDGENQRAGGGVAAAEGEDDQQNEGMTAQQVARIQATMLNIALEEEVDEGLLEVETMDDGVLVRVREQGSFPSGTADMASAFLPVLRKISGAIVSSDSRLVISGHTDNRPISTARYPSNWMLSAARATSVVQALARQGYIAKERMEVRAHADTVPVEDNGTSVGRARNRRIEIFIGAQPIPAPPDSPTAEVTTPENTT